MKTIKHRSLKALQNSANHYGLEVYETGVSYSFRIFENKQTKEFHVFYKPEPQSNFTKFNVNGNLRNKLNRCILFLLAIVLLASCAGPYKCRPSKGSRDYAVTQWIKQRSDGYYVVTTIRGFRYRSIDVYECKPDSIELERLKSI